MKAKTYRYIFVIVMIVLLTAVLIAGLDALTCEDALARATWIPGYSDYCLEDALIRATWLA
ncbi:MAG: hypothetical protein AMJ73_05020 [candidate division Zixibacteria bacterium SM1_73]|nr:MAG: hypothetical protein AMJ73_05020 [candidate division Zixibacteria bacterium SM1_73]